LFICCCSGQTGSGKTYTMVADQAMTLTEALSTPSSSSGHGIVPRTVHELFQALEQQRACSAATAAAGCATTGSAASLAGTTAEAAAGEVKLVLSYLKIYNDRLYDLLQLYKPGSSRCGCIFAVKPFGACMFMFTALHAQHTRVLPHVLGMGFYAGYREPVSASS
jgi:hypothetical protein